MTVAPAGTALLPRAPRDTVAARLAGRALRQPGRGTVNSFRCLLRDLSGQAGLAALGRHRLQLLRDGPQLMRGLTLLGRRLFPRLAAGLAEQVPGMARGLGNHLPG